MPHKAPDKIRNVALIGHRGSGKTSVCESVLFEAGIVNRLGRTTDGSTVADFEPDEHEREMSIGATVASFDYHDRKINLIDTPGDPSFVADTLGAMRVVDAAVVVVNAVMGVEVHTDRLWQRADREGLARLVYVNMLDRERADFFRTLDSLKEAFGPHVVATEIPIGVEHEARGVIDLIDMKAFVYEGEGRGNATEQEIPEDLEAQAQEYREKLMDEVAENSDELMERYLEGEEISHDELVQTLKKGVTEGHLFPVTCGIATKNLGTSRLLEAIIEDLPSPAMRGAVTAIAEDGEEVEVEPDPDGELVAYVFKTTADPYTGRINLLRVYSGVLRSDSQVMNSTRGGEGADRPARRAPGQGARDRRRAGSGRHRRRGEAARDPSGRRPGRPEGGQAQVPGARPAGAGDGVCLRAQDQGRRGEGRGGDPAPGGGGSDARRPPRPRDGRANHRRAHPGPRRGDRRPDEAPVRRRDRAAPASGALPRGDPQGPPRRTAATRSRPAGAASSATATSRSSRASRAAASSSSTRSRAASSPAGSSPQSRRGSSRRWPRGSSPAIR